MPRTTNTAIPIRKVFLLFEGIVIATPWSSASGRTLRPRLSAPRVSKIHAVSFKPGLPLLSLRVAVGRVKSPHNHFKIHSQKRTGRAQSNYALCSSRGRECSDAGGETLWTGWKYLNFACTQATSPERKPNGRFFSEANSSF